MAGSFDIFRKYQRSLLVFVAILAMLAFFVLPPILQMGFSGGDGGDPVAVTWSDGVLREAELDRAVALRRVVNRFLVESAMAAGRDAAQLPLFNDSEEQVVQSMMLAREAASLGLVVSDSAINNFLSQWTNNLVRPEQFGDIIAGLRLGPMGVSQRDLFDAIRMELAARNLFVLFQTGFSGDPPDWRWDYFRRLQQQATIEVVPIVVESVADEVREPSVSELRNFFNRYKDALPQPRSTEPGFREPHRVKYQYLMAKRETFLEKAKKTITDKEIADYYEENKVTMFRERPKPPAEDTESNEQKKDNNKKKIEKSATKPKASKKDEQKNNQNIKKNVEKNDVPPDSSQDAAGKKKQAPKSKGDSKDKQKKPPKTSGDTSDLNETQGSVRPAGVYRTVALRQEDNLEVSSESGSEKSAKAILSTTDTAADAKASDGEEGSKGSKDDSRDSTKSKPSAAPQTGTSSDEPLAKSEGEKTQKSSSEADEKSGESKPQDKKEDEPKFEPLENVTEEIRDRLASERADQEIDAIFTAIAGDMTAYAEDLALWQARQEKGEAPQPPDFEKIAAQQSLEAGGSELVSADEAIAAGGVGQSFELVPDRTSRFGLRQQNWVEQIYGDGVPSLRPVTSRDVSQNRYLSWKIEDQPEFTPTFESARSDVIQAWKIIEGRSLAEEKAKSIAAECATSEEGARISLADVVAGQELFEASKVGPFSWLTQGTVPQGTPPSLSDPDGLIMPGDDFMEAIFMLQPGQAGIAFNDPKTICYAVQMESLAPPLEELQKQFLDQKGDQRRIAMVAQREFSEAINEWLDGLESKYGLEWKRQPRQRNR
ncbi:MAG: hypothetical protein ABGW78_12550 [Pirellulales bacterium]